MLCSGDGESERGTICLFVENLRLDSCVVIYRHQESDDIPQERVETHTDTKICEVGKEERTNDTVSKF